MAEILEVGDKELEPTTKEKAIVLEDKDYLLIKVIRELAETIERLRLSLR